MRAVLRVRALGIRPVRTLCGWRGGRAVGATGAAESCTAPVVVRDARCCRLVGCATVFSTLLLLYARYAGYLLDGLNARSRVFIDESCAESCTAA